MKIVVLVKQTFDTEAKVEVSKDGKISDQGVNLIINPYDEVAVEEALQIQEKDGGEVIVVSAGNDKVVEAIRQALAMGADKGVHVALENNDIDEYARAIALAKAIKDLEPDIVLCGHVAADDGSSQVPTRVAEIIGMPHVNVVNKLEIADNKATCTREVDGGSEIIEVALPAIITCQVGMNEPRYPSMRGIMKAKKKPVDKVEGEKAENKTKVVTYFLPPAKAPGIIVEGDPAETVPQLVEWLKKEAKVI